jgi:flagellar secretion chaperone FliS
MRHPASTYRQFSVQGATPLGLVVMLYDGAIAALQRAAAAIAQRNLQEKCAHLNRTSAIIAQLEGTLNFTQGGEVAKTLKSLYIYTRQQILKGNLENSPEVLQALVGRLSEVREAWYAADHQPSGAAPTTAPEASGGVPQPSPCRRPAYPAASPPAKSPYEPSPGTEPGSWRVSA